MAKRQIDYLLDDEEDLLIENGDFVRGECTGKHQRTLLLCAKGDFKANPTICVDVNSYTDNDDKLAVKREIVKEFSRDGMRVQDMRPNPESLTDNKVNVFIGANYQD